MGEVDEFVDSEEPELSELEQKCFLYDPKAGSLLCFIITVENTVVPHVLSRFELWIFLVFHFIVMWFAKQGHLGDLDEENDPYAMSSESLKVITMMTTFFEVF